MKFLRRIAPSFWTNWPAVRMKMVSSPTLPSWTNCAASKQTMHDQRITTKKNDLKTISMKNNISNSSKSVS